MTPVEYVQLGERVALGAFFTISGAHKVFVPEVHARVLAMFKKVGAPLAEWPVPLGEMAGGLALLVGFLTPFAAVGLILILAGAVYLDVWQSDVVAKHPRDGADWIAKTLYCPEVLMLWLLASIILLGPGPLSLDGMLWA